MRINESRIRQIIREELGRISEMSLAGRLTPRRSRDPEAVSRWGGGNDPGGGREAAERYASSDKFLELATKRFERFPNPVWLAPLIGADPAGLSVYDGAPDITGMARTASTDLDPDGIELLLDIGYDPEEVGKIRGGDTVILYTTDTTHRSTIASPSNIMHAWFDSGEDVELAPEYSQLLQDLWWGDAEEELDVLGGEEYSGWTPAILDVASVTQGWFARGNQPTDLLAEIMAAELTRKKGFHFDERKVDPKYGPGLHALKRRIVRAAADFHENARGKLLIVGVS